MKKLYPHLLVGSLMILLSVILERAVYTNYDLLKESPVILNKHMAIAPVYNTAGSWLHGRWESMFAPWEKLGDKTLGE